MPGDRGQKVRVLIIADDRERRLGIDEHAVGEQSTALGQILSPDFLGSHAVQQHFLEVCST